MHLATLPPPSAVLDPLGTRDLPSAQLLWAPESTGGQDSRPPGKNGCRMRNVHPSLPSTCVPAVALMDVFPSCWGP